MLLSWVDQKRMSMIQNGWPFDLVEKEKRITATAAVAAVKPPNTQPRMRPQAEMKEPDSPEWPPSSFSDNMKSSIVECEDVLVKNLETIDCEPLEVKMKPNSNAFFS